VRAALVGQEEALLRRVTMVALFVGSLIACGLLAVAALALPPA
jgi:hypothetical protein